MITPDLSILNQLGTPMFNSNTFANRPNAGILGRIFISTDTKKIYRDTGTSWDELGGGGSISGTGTPNTLPIWTTSTQLGNSLLKQDGSSVLLGATADQGIFQLDGSSQGGLMVTTSNSQFGITIKNSSSSNKKWDISPNNNNLQFNESGASPVIVLKSGGGNNVRLYSYTTDGFVKTSATDGTLSIDTTSYQPLLTNPVTGTGTATRVAFWSGSSAISSNANLYWDNINSRLGINTATPGMPLDIHTASGNVASFNGQSTNDAFAYFQNAGSNKWRFGNNYSTGENYFSIYDSVNSLEVFKISAKGNIATYAINTAAAGTSSQSFYNSNTLTVPASTTFSAGGYTYSAINSFQAFNFGGNATFQNNNIASSYTGINRLDFTGTGTVTMSQTAGHLRTMSASTFQNQYNGTANGTISHLSGLQILGFYRSNGASQLTVTNAYGLVINDLDDYAAGFTLTNRYGIYQEGSNDQNYFGGKLINTVKYNRQTASYTLVSTDRSKMIEMNVASANTLTVPLNSSVPFEIGTEIEVIQYGAGATTITATSGVTIRSLSGNLKIAGQYVAVSLIKVATDEWYCFGNLIA